jgi:hypothetical protein
MNMMPLAALEIEANRRSRSDITRAYPKSTK